MKGDGQDIRVAVDDGVVAYPISASFKQGVFFCV